jgi:antirestriction protein ArdC
MTKWKHFTSIRTSVHKKTKQAEEVTRDLIFGQQVTVFPVLAIDCLAAAYLQLPSGTAV